MSVAEKKSLTIAELAQYDGPLYAINKTKTVISADDGADGYLRIPPVTSDENIQPLPKKVAQSMGFQKLWRTGQVEVTTDPSIEEELVLSNKREVEKQNKLQREYNQHLTKSSSAGDIFVGETLNKRGQANIENYHFGETPPNNDYSNWSQTEVDGKIAWIPVTIAK